MLYDYGQLTTAEVKTHAQNQWMNQHRRDAQNAEMLYHFLFKSLFKTFKATELLKNHNYQVTLGTYTTEDGPCSLKQLLSAPLLTREQLHRKFGNRLWI